MKKAKYRARAGLHIDIDYTKCRMNPGMRTISKLFLNSLRGKFGQRSNLDSMEFISDYNTFVKHYVDREITNARLTILMKTALSLFINQLREHQWL